MGWLDRTELLLGAAAMARLAAARVCVVGLGAVGSYAVEGLARSGVGFLRLADFDVIRESNLNRQLLALRSTLGHGKAVIAAARVRDINPACAIETVTAFIHRENLADLLSGNIDLVIDAVDSLSPKTEIIAAAAERGIPVFSAMGAATRRQADRIAFAPLFEASGCPLARHLKKRLRRRQVTGDLWCVYSNEEKNPEAVLPAESGDHEGGEYTRGRRRDILGSLSTLTGLFGLRLAHEAVLRLAAAKY